MSYTYLGLCNDVLRRINEVEIAEADFSTVQGIQSLSKDAVQDILDTINYQEFEWPWNHTHVSTPLVQGQVDYDFGANIKIPEWDSFLIIDPDSTMKAVALQNIPREEWYKTGREADYAAGNDGLSKPEKVFRNSDHGFGVTPSPDKVYTVRFEAYNKRQELVLPGDVPTVPSEFRHVIVAGALYHMYMFRDNSEQAALTLSRFEQGLRSMQTLYINQFPHIFADRRIG